MNHVTTPRRSGHSLPELLVVLLVLALLAGLGAPALHVWALDLQLQTTLDELARGLALARTEAVATGRVVEFRFRTPPSGQRLSINRTAILFSPSGSATPATLTLCDRRATGRSLVVARSGRVRAASGQCGFAMVEALAAMVLLAVSALALAQSVLQARNGLANSSLQAAAADAVTAAAEGSRLLGPQAQMPPEAAPLAAAWRGTYTGGNSSTPVLVLAWQPAVASTAPTSVDSAAPLTVWQASASAGHLQVALEIRP